MLDKIKAIDPKFIKTAGGLLGAMLVGAAVAVVVGQMDEEPAFFEEEPVEETVEE